MDIFSTDSYVCKKLWFRDGFSKVIANTFASKTQYSLLIARLFAPKSQYSHRTLAIFGDCRRAILEKCFLNLTWMSVIDFNEFYIDEIVLIRAFQRAIKRRDTISGTLISSFKSRGRFHHGIFQIPFHSIPFHSRFSPWNWNGIFHLYIGRTICNSMTYIVSMRTLNSMLRKISVLFLRTATIPIPCGIFHIPKGHGIE